MGNNLHADEVAGLDPDMRLALEKMQAHMAEGPAMGTGTTAEMRARFASLVAGWNADPPPVARVEDGTISTANRDIAVRLYDPVAGGRPHPALVYFHGGAWMAGDLDSNDRALRLLALGSGVSILSAAYCLAPEHPFPAPLNECLAVARWVREHGETLGIDVDRLAMGGDSAGANLALAAALDLRDSGETWLRYLLLICGAYARDLDTASYRSFGDGRYGFGAAAMETAWSLYAGAAPRGDPRVEPLRAELGGLPPVCLVAGGLDPLRDDSRALARRLIDASGSVEYREYPGVVHGFASMTRDLAVARRAMLAAAASLRRALGEVATPPSPAHGVKGDASA
ncbi:MAG TPA: alpha/beta hydrolase [Woeseiaceae bacterium]|nr:alpha/beta hydrolase [Woeseiaceae bacterium]